MYTKWYEKEKEKSVVSSSDTIVDPWTMMIKRLENIINIKHCIFRNKKILTNLNAMITHTTMRASWWSIELTSNAPFHSNSDSIYFYIFVQRCPKIIFPIFIRRSYKIIINSSQTTNTLPFGITPGSIKVANVKFAKTKNVMTPW